MPCGCETKAAFTAEATAPACYGPGVRALAAYLAVHQHLPYDRMAELFADLLGIEVSVGALAQMVAEAGGALGPSPRSSPTCCAMLRRRALRRDRRPGGGEASLGPRAPRRPCHPARLPPERGRAAMDDLGVIDQMTGIAHHDGWKPYRAYDVVHPLCNAHHLRELDEIGSIATSSGPTTWSTLLCEAKDIVERPSATGATVASIRRRCTRSVSATARSSPPGWTPTPARPRTSARLREEGLQPSRPPRHPAGRRPALRLDFHASFDNNQGRARHQDGEAPTEDLGLVAHLAGARTSAPSAATSRPCASTTTTSSTGYDPVRGDALATRHDPRT